MVTNPLLKTLFERRGYDRNFLDAINGEPHGKPLYIEEMADALHEVKQGRVVVLTDFDADGIMAGVLSFAGLSELGFAADLYTPDASDGYIWGKNVIDKLLSQFPDTMTIFTCDSGISCNEGIGYAKSLGLRVLVTDHHRQAGDLPPADLIVDPRQDFDPFGFDICGSHVAYLVLEAYAEKYGNLFLQSQIQRLKVFAGIATVTDLMPVLYENRKFVSNAVTICVMSHLGLTSGWTGSEPYSNAFAGLSAMLRCFDMKKKLYVIDETLFGWQVGPLLNSPKRMGKSVSAAFSLFLSDRDEERFAAFEELYFFNEERKALIAEVMAELDSSYQPYAPFIYFSDASAGLLGLAASKILNKTGLPCIVASRKHSNVCKGSGRSPAWLPFLSFAAELGLPNFSASGHEGAFGVSFLGTDAAAIYDALSKQADLRSEILEDDDALRIGSGMDMDAPLDYFKLKAFYKACKAFKPYGVGFSEPTALLVFDKVSDCLEWSRMGDNGQHWKGRSKGNFDILLWNHGHIDINKIKKPVISGRFSESDYAGFWSLTFVGELVEF